MVLQKLIHSQDDIMTADGQNAIIVHGVDEVSLGGEYTMCGRAIIDSVLAIDGWEAIGKNFVGGVNKCECRDCLKVIRYYKSLK